MTFQDHFSSVADRYARFRPSYPEALFAELARRVPSRDRAWDCGTGNGQAARGLARYFQLVIASDPSRAQLAAGSGASAEDRARGRLVRVACTAEAAALAPRSVSLVVVAQALHWFDTDAFYAEVRRIGRPGGLLAVWSYGLCRLTPAVDEVLDTLYHDGLAGHWAPERRHVEAGYRTLPFPFDEEAAPDGLALERELTRAEVEGYVGTWSAVRAARKSGTDPLADFGRALAEAWPAGLERLTAQWPLAVRFGRIG